MFFRHFIEIRKILLRISRKGEVFLQKFDDFVGGKM